MAGQRDGIRYDEWTSEAHRDLICERVHRLIHDRHILFHFGIEERLCRYPKRQSHHIGMEIASSIALPRFHHT
jgi:hypothetical protein